eukprot:TRINITY_DN499_c0_g1_i2.p1 TRINITY_DN499_c0_g1~~TRINITY_DN499_c0_g1_i2.p1  ORF type:complete len:449 (-),score=139.35 TRINITY_DN499_c0_g1_i2:30-1376(-)
MDINLFRADKGGNPDLVRESQRRRGDSVEVVDQIIALDLLKREADQEANDFNRRKNELSRSFNEVRKAGGDLDAVRAESAALKEAVAQANQKAADLQQQLDELMYTVGNLVHDSVPVSNDEENNEVVSTWGDRRENEEFEHHDQLLYRIGGFEPQKGNHVAGHRGYYLTGPGLWLNQALINYGLQFLHKKGFQTMQTPFFLNKDIMHKVSQLSEYDESLYKIIGENNEEKYLIATSEQALCGFHDGMLVNPSSLPLKYGGYSTCFRKEAGSSGRDNWGIFRVHQFEKVEQFVVTAADKSWEMHEELREMSEEFYQALGLPYRVVAIVSGELNNAAAKKYDLEAWFPGFQDYRELVSNSNCTDYQSRRLGVINGVKKEDGSKEYVHMLNCTLTATERTICCIMENYQTEGGVRVPEVLQPFMAPFLEDPTFIPFVREGYEKVEPKQKKK